MASNKSTIEAYFSDGLSPTRTQWHDFADSIICQGEHSNQYMNSKLFIASGSNQPFSEVAPPFVPNLHHYIKVYNMDPHIAMHHAIIPNCQTNTFMWERDTDNSAAIDVVSNDTDFLGGNILLTPGGADGNQTCLATAAEPFTCATNKPWWIRTRFTLSNADGMEVFFGLTEEEGDSNDFHTADPANGKDRVGFVKAAHDGLTFGYAVSKGTGGTKLATPSVAQAYINDNSIQSLGIYWDGEGNIKFYSNNTTSGNVPGPMTLAHTYSTSANIPDDSNLRLILCIINGESAANSSKIEYLQGAYLTS